MNSKRDESLRRTDELLPATHSEPELKAMQEVGPPPAASLAGNESQDDRLLVSLRTSEILNSIHSFNEVVPRFMDLVIRCLKAERGILFLLDGKGAFVPIAQANVEEQCVDDAMEYSQKILRHAAEDHILWSENAGTDTRFSQYQSIAAFNIKSFLCVPIKRRDQIVGTVYVDNRSVEHAFDKGDLQFLRRLANQAGIAIENARLHDELKAENQLLRSEIQQTRPTAPTGTLEGSATVRPLEEMERDAILAALRQKNGNRTAAAQALGISVRKLQYKIKEYQEAGFADL